MSRKKPKGQAKAKPRNTMDVDPSWLESEPEPPPPPPRLPQELAPESAPDKPPPAGPRRRETMEVQMDWLEPPEPHADEAEKREKTSGPRKPVIPPLLVAKPRGKLPPPLPRSEPPVPRRTSRRPPGSKGS